MSSSSSSDEEGEVTTANDVHVLESQRQRILAKLRACSASDIIRLRPSTPISPIRNADRKRGGATPHHHDAYDPEVPAKRGKVVVASSAMQDSSLRTNSHTNSPDTNEAKENSAAAQEKEQGEVSPLGGQNNGVHLVSDTEPSNAKKTSLLRSLKESVGCEPEFRTFPVAEAADQWRSEVSISGTVCSFATGLSKEAAERAAVNAVLEKYGMEEDPLDSSFVSVTEEEDTTIEKDPGTTEGTESTENEGEGEAEGSAEPVEGVEGVDADADADEEDYDSGSDLDPHQLLEQQLGPSSSSTTAEPRLQPVSREKVVLKNRSAEFFEVLPDGWIEITHRSGLPVYLHKSSRVCTFSRPYFLGPGSTRNHEVPLAAIPCLHQRDMKAQKDKMDKSNEEGAKEEEKEGAKSKLNVPRVELQTAEDFKSRHLTAEQLNGYCQSTFEFEKIKIIRFRRWADNRTFHKQKRQTAVKIQQLGRPTLPSNVKLITVPSLESTNRPQKKPFYLNPQGKTSIAVLHEYVQKVLKGQLQYEFTETRNPTKPYCASVRLSSYKSSAPQVGHLLAKLDKKTSAKDGSNLSQDEWVKLGDGLGSSKKLARLDAAESALKLLVPGLEFDEEGVAANQEHKDHAAGLFDHLSITDSRVTEFSSKAGQPSPFIILQESLKRNATLGDTEISTEMKRVGHQQHLYTMKVGKHTVEVSCTNKKDGKQKASQHMIEKIFPQVKTWGALIRMYGYDAHRKLHETRREKDSIIKLQSQGRSTNNEPNHAILDKLRDQMRRLYTSTESSQDKATSEAALVGKIDF